MGSTLPETSGIIKISENEFNCKKIKNTNIHIYIYTYM